MEESLLKWTWNGDAQEPLLCSAPDADGDALLRGFLLTSGAVDSPSRILEIIPSGDAFRVVTDIPPRGLPSLAARLERLTPPAPDFRISLRTLESLFDRAVMDSPRSDGLHTVLLSDGRVSALGRDLGRNNALDKAVGRAVVLGLDPEHAALCCSGRISLEIFARAAAARIPVLATWKKVGSLSVDYGNRLGIAVCRLGADSVCFSAPWRIMP